MKFFKRFHPFEIALVFVILTIHMYAALSDAYNLPNTWFTRDDAYYYFKVAQNITEGRGSTFDGINPTNGYHPLWMVICVPIFALARFDLVLPLRILLMVMAGFNAATAILIYRLVKANLSHAVAILAASFWAFNFYIHYIVYEFGLETPLAAFSVALFIYKLSQFERRWRTEPVTPRQLALLAGISAMVLFSRLDLVFLALIAGIWIVLRGHAIRSLLPLDLVIIFFSLTTSVALRTGIKTYNDLYAASAIEAVVICALLKLTFLYFFGAYHLRSSTNPLWNMSARTLSALVLGEVVAAGLYLVSVQLGFGRDFPRSAFVLDLVISTIFILGLRLAVYPFGGTNDKTDQPRWSALVELKNNWKNWLAEGSIYYGILGGSLACYMLFNQLLFGTSTPVSGQIKRWWGVIGNTVYDYPAPNWPAFWGISEQGVYSAWQPLPGLFAWIATIVRPLYPGADTRDERYFIVMAVCGIIFIAILFFNRQQAREKFDRMAIIPLFAGCALHILSYTTSAYGGAKEWYWVSQMVLLVLAGSTLLDILLQPFRNGAKAQINLQLASLAIGIYMAIAFAGFVKNVMHYDRFPADRPLMEVIPYLEENTPPGALIGMTGGGNVGYFIHDRTIVNMDGLINSYDYFKAVQNGSAQMYLYERGMKLVFANPRLLVLPPYNRQFTPYLESYSVYGGKDLMYLLEEPKY
jgi:hypothetical protein